MSDICLNIVSLAAQIRQPRSFENHLKRNVSISASGQSIIQYDIGSEWDATLNPFLAAQKAAALLFERWKTPISIPLSGGIDSEAMALSFLAAKIPIAPVIMKFKGGYNDFDTRWAESFCKRHSLIPRYFNLDLDLFFISGNHLEYAKKYLCRSPQLATHLWLAEQIQEPLVFPHNPLPVLETQKNKIYASFPPDLYLTYDLFFENNNKPGIGWFFLYTPDLIYSFMQLPLYLEILFNHINFKRTFSTNQYLIKVELYRAGGFDVFSRPDKATGFELYREHLNKIHDSRGNDYFDINFRKPMEDIVQDPKLLSLGNLNLKKLYSRWIEI